MDGVTPEEQVTRACAVLALCASCVETTAEIDRVLALGPARDRWHEARSAFEGLRARSKTAPPPELALLRVAECVAKLIANASGGVAPFDLDQAVRLSALARGFVISRGDEALARAVWRALAGLSS